MLSNGKVDVVDHDVDIMVGTTSEAEWCLGFFFAACEFGLKVLLGKKRSYRFMGGSDLTSFFCFFLGGCTCNRIDYL